MPTSPGVSPIVAHLIVGNAVEPYLEAALASIATVCAHAVVNDNAGTSDGANLAAIRASRFAVEGRLTLLQTPFSDFASARNACIDATPSAFSNSWALRVDADEVFDDGLSRLRANLERIASNAQAVDGYSRHFVGSFAYYTEIARQMLLFRLDRGLRWRNPVHERLESVARRVPTPLLLFHYGHVVPPHVEQARGLRYASLGQSTADQLDARQRHTTASMWGRLLAQAIPFEGRHPPAAAETLARLRQTWREQFEEVERIVAEQSPFARARNGARALNYGRLLFWRRLQTRVRFGVAF